MSCELYFLEADFWDDLLCSTFRLADLYLAASLPVGGGDAMLDSLSVWTWDDLAFVIGPDALLFITFLSTTLPPVFTATAVGVTAFSILSAAFSSEMAAPSSLAMN